MLVPSEAFKRASHDQRGKSERGGRTSDPIRYRRNHIQRDLLMAEHYRRGARGAGLPLIEVDGSRTAEEVATVVAAHYEPQRLVPLTESMPRHERRAAGQRGQRG